MVDFEDLKYAHKNGCKCKEVVHKNICCDEQGEVEYDAYCPECGAYLYHFSYGQYEI